MIVVTLIEAREFTYFTENYKETSTNGHVPL